MSLENFVTKSGTLTADGKLQFVRDYKILTQCNENLSFGTIRVLYKNETKKTIHDLMCLDENKKIKSHFCIDKNKASRADHNVLLTYTGKKYDRLICIDIDINHGENETEEQKNGVNIFEKYLNFFDANHTLKCRTPRGGMHYLFYLTRLQDKKLEELGGLSNLQNVGLFGTISDLLYNNGRAWMAGFVRKPSGVYQYSLLGSGSPLIMPEFIFDEIYLRIRLIKQKPPRSIYILDEYERIFNIQRQKEVIKKESIIETPTVNNTDEDAEMIKQYLNCLKPERCSTYADWIKIGLILFNEGYDFYLFNEWSKQCKQKYDRDSVRETWDKLNSNTKKSKVRLGTLIKLAKEDNYNNNYVELKKKLSPKLDVVLNKYGVTQKIYEGFVNLVNSECIDTDLANFFKCVYDDDYIFDKFDNNWYEANEYGIFMAGHKDLISARQKFSNNMYEYTEKCKSAYVELVFKSKNKENSEKVITEFYNKVNKICKRFRTVNSKKILIEQLKENYAVETFIESKNPHDNLFAFKNGVYDMKTYTFRPALKSELVCGTTGYNYSPSTEEDRKLVEDTVKNMFLNEELYTYFMTIISHRFIKRIIHEEIYFMIGPASNGKGLVTTLIQNTFGRFAQVLEPATFTSTKHGVSADAATPALASTHGKNIVFINELPRHTKLKSDILKRLSGNDKIKTRFNYGEFFEFTPTYNLFFVSNFEPIVDGTDEGIQRRLRYIPFNVRFVDNPKKEGERKINYDLKKQFEDKRYSCAFFDILVGFYKDYVNNGCKLFVPNEVKKQTETLLNENDPIKKFIEERLVVTDNDKDFIRSSDLYNMFKNYSKVGKKYTTPEFKRSMLNNTGIQFKLTKKASVFTNIVIKEEEPDTDDDIIEV